MPEETRNSRREILKTGAKAIAFAIPVMTSFKIADCRVKASTVFEPQKGSLRIHAEF
jgi:hypothetical protein